MAAASPAGPPPTTATCGEIVIRSVNIAIAAADCQTAEASYTRLLPRRGRVARPRERAIMAELRTGGEWVVEVLRAQGVRHVFGLPGVHNLAIYDAVLRQHATDPRPHVRHTRRAHRQGAGRASRGAEPDRVLQACLPLGGDDPRR